MAKFSVNCPNCSKSYSIDEANLGRKGKCKVCQTTFVLASAPAQVAQSAPEPPLESPRAGRQFEAEDQVPDVWQPGDVILDLYEVQQVFESGGMGLVYKVHHKGSNLTSAVKCPRAKFFKSEQDKQNFEREAETWVNLGLHPHTVSCHYVRRLGGIPRVFAEYMEGGSLKDWIDSGKLYTGGPDQALTRILDIAIQFAWGLNYAHEQGLIHQDVKPANVLMTEDGIAKVSDFGLAKAQAAHREIASSRVGASILVTAGGMTPAYCSPEQANRQPLSRRTDLWSWAVSVLEMFLGCREWGQVPGNVVGEWFAEAFQELEPTAGRPRMPLQVAELLRRCFEWEPNDRPRDMLEVVESLRSLFRQVTGEDYPREKPRPAELLADWRNNQAVSLLDLGKPEAAEKKWQEALSVDPHHPEATFNWGLIQWRSARMTDQKLLEKLREVRVSSADTARVDYLLGLVHLERADAQAAVQMLSKAVEADGGRTEIASALALAKSMCEPAAQLPRTFEGHTNEVASVSWSPDGRCALSGSWDQTLRLWEVSSGKCLRTFAGHSYYANSVSWSPDGCCALSASHDKTLRLWEVATGKCLRTCEGHTSFVTSVSWNPEGRCALSGSYDNTLRLWDVSSGKCLRTFEGHTKAVTSVSWSPDGRCAVSGSTDQTLRLWEVCSGKCLATFEGHTDSVTSVSGSADGRYALSGSDDNTLRLWEVSSGKCLRTFAGHTSWVSSVSWSPDGRCVLSGSGDNTLRLWEVSSGKCLRTFEGHTNGVSSVSWSPDGRYALSGSRDNTLRLWGIVFATQPVPLVASMAFAVRSALYHHLLQKVRDAFASEPAVAAGFLQQAKQQPGCSRREETLELARRLSHSLAHRSFVDGWEKHTFEGHTSSVSSVSWSPDGRCVISGSMDNTLRLWEVFGEKCLRTFEGHTNGVSSVSWSPDGRYALSGSKDNTLRLWEVSSGQCLHTFEGHTHYVDSVSWSPDGRCALSGSYDNTLRLWEVSSGQCLRTFEGHAHYVNTVSWNPDGRCALSGSYDNTLRLWDVSSGKCLRTFEGHTKAVTSVSWSPDGRCALSGSGDKTLRLWEISSGQCLRTFQGHTHYVDSVSWSPDGRFAISGSSDNTLRLWEVPSGTCLRTFEGHANGVSSVSWSPDGRFALSGSSDRTLRRWELDWEFELNQPADWDKGARPWLAAFLTIHTPYANGLARRGKPTWTEDDFCRLLDKLGCAGFGWLRPEGVRRELEKMAANWQGPPPLG